MAGLQVSLQHHYYYLLLAWELLGCFAYDQILDA